MQPSDVITGHVDNLNPQFFTLDPVDFFQYSGLQPGSFFDVFVELTDPNDNGTIFASASANDLSQTQLDFENIKAPGTGTVPSDGNLVVGITVANQQTFSGFEEYRISLTTNAVPVPASVALVAAGLVGLGGLHVARRKAA